MWRGRTAKILINPFRSTSFGERQLGAMPIARTARTAQYGPAARRQLVQ